MGQTMISYLVLFVLVIVARLVKDRLFSNNPKEGTQVGAVVQSPAEPVVVFANPIEEYTKKHYPDAYR